MMRALSSACLAILLAPSVLAQEECREVDVLFTGNSFTYYSNLPELVKMMAEDRCHTFNYHKSLRGGSTLFGLMNNLPHIKLVDNLMNDTLSFDYIVAHTHSRLPTVKGAREKMFWPSFERMAGLTKGMGHDTKIISYMTWGYDQIDTRYMNTELPHNASTYSTPRPNFPGGCPNPLSREEFHVPYGNLPELTGDCMFNSTYNETVRSKDCMQYSLARGYTETLNHGSDYLAPCGLAWQLVRGEIDPCEEGREIVDAQYDYELPYTIPFPVEFSNDTLKTLRSINLQLDYGRNNHQNHMGQYLNALVHFTMMFGEDPRGLPARTIIRHNRVNDDPPSWMWDYNNETWVDIPLGQAGALQEVAAKLVYDNLDFWRNVFNKPRPLDSLKEELENVKESLSVEILFLNYTIGEQQAEKEQLEDELEQLGAELELLGDELDQLEAECESTTCDKMVKGWPKAKKTQTTSAADACDCEEVCKELSAEAYVWKPETAENGCLCLNRVVPYKFKKVKPGRDGQVYYQMIL